MRIVHANQGSYESQASTIKAIAPKSGCGADRFRGWDQQEETDTGHRDGAMPEERFRIKELEHEVRERRQANAILKKTLADFVRPLGDCEAILPRGASVSARPLPVIRNLHLNAPSGMHVLRPEV